MCETPAFCRGMEKTMSEMQSEFVLITPALAEKLLAKLDPRQIGRYSESTADFYANQMLKGTWDNSPQSISISDQGFLLDGQHRLHAIKMSSKAINMLVVKGVDAAAFKHIDAGKIRGLAFRSGIKKEDVALLQIAFKICSYSMAAVRAPTVEQIALCWEFLKNDIERFRDICPVKRRARINPAALQAAVVLRMKTHPDDVDAIAAAYNAYVAVNLKDAPHIMSVLYRRMTENYNPQMNIFVLGWKGFDPAKFEESSVGIKIVGIADTVKLVQKLALQELKTCLF